MPMSCVHIGAKQHDEDTFAKYRGIVRRTGASVILLGDVIDNGVYSGTKVPGSVYENTMDPDEQIDTAVRIFKELNPRRVIGGNHCERTRKAVGVHPEKVIADRLGVPFTPDVWATRIEGVNCVFSHGVGAGDGDFRRVLLAYDNADLVCLGHNHELSYRPVRRVHMGGAARKVIHQVRCGSFFDYGGYAKRALAQPGPTGCPIIGLRDGRVRVTIEV